MKTIEQTYLTEVVDSSGRMVTFERWSYKRLSTVLGKLQQLYFGNYSFIYERYLQPGNKIIVYKTVSSPSEGEKVKEFTIDELKNYRAA